MRIFAPTTSNRGNSLSKLFIIIALIAIYCILVQAVAIKCGLSMNPVGPVPNQVLPGSIYSFSSGSYGGLYETQKMEEIRRAQLGLQMLTLQGQSQTSQLY